MKTKIILIFFICSAINIFAQGVWTQKASFAGSARGDAFSFSIGNKGYVGGGEDTSNNYVNDFWEYDASSNTWTQKANFVGGARWQAMSFSIGLKGYVVSGQGSSVIYSDCWEYDPSSNTWIQMANLPTEGRSAGIGFSIGNKGYMGTGYGCSPPPCTETNHKDFWEYNPATNTWTQKANIPTNGRGFAFGLSIGSKGYVGTGHDDFGNPFNDFWEYNPVTDIWVQKANYPGGQRNDIDGAHFSICNYGFVGTGNNSQTYYNEFWKYDPSNDTWTQIPNLPALDRIGMSGFSINNKGYVGFGFHMASNYIHLNDFWEYNIIDANISQTNLLCNGQCTGTAIANPLGGVAPYTYNWSNGETTQSITGLCVGTYNVTIYNASCGTTMASVTITQPSAISLTTSVTNSCTGNATGTATVNSIGGSPAYTYNWSNGQTTQTATGLSGGTYTVIVIDANGCTNTTTAAFIALPSPTATITGNTTICSGQSTTLNASGGGTYSWNTGQTTSSIIISPTATGTYSVVVSIGSCTDTASANITVLASPTPTISGNNILCTGDITTLTASGGNNYSWNTGVTTSSIILNPSTTTSYTVIVSNTNGCSNTTSINITVAPPPIAGISGNTNICAGESATLSASGIGSYLWSNGATTTSISPSTGGTYSVIVSIGSCSDTASATVIVNPTPTATTSGIINIFQGQNSTLSASGGSTYLWNTGSTDSVITVSPMIDSTYCVTVADLNNCTDTSCITIFVESPCDTAGEFFFPNAFSPNGDGENDDLKIYFGNLSCIQALRLVIYERWGEKVFETSDTNFQWDGKYLGKLLNSQVLSYYLHVEFTDKTTFEKKGNISLVR